MKRGKFPKAVAANPHVVRTLEARFAEGKRYESANDFATAEKIYREIVATYARNRLNSATPNAALGYALLSQKRFDEAEKVLQKSIEQDSNLLEAQANLAAVYRFIERWPECIRACRRALAINPKHLESLLNAAAAYKGNRQYAPSVQSFLLALALDPDNLEARKGLASTYVDLGETSVSIPMFRKVLEMDAEAWPWKSYLLFAMQYEPTLSNEEVLQEHLSYGQTSREKVGPPKNDFVNSTASNRRLRIGYLSADFKYHVVMRFVEQVLASHDRDSLEIFLIMTGAKQDKDTERIRQYADHWLDISDMKDDQASELIWDHELDIVVDLVGHTGGARLALLARRLAPVQISWCGYSGTTGIDTMDYVVVDDVLAPPGEKTFLSETPLRLPHCYLSFQSRDSHDVSKLPFEKNGYITLGCMNNPSKINKYVVSWWAEILKAIPDSKLLMRYGLFVDSLVRERIAKMFRECGISSERFAMLEGNKDFITVYNDVDLALDTFPYNGTTTTCEALWMGVPAVTLRGDRFVARVGASLLTYTNLQEFIAESPAEYIDIAIRLASDPKRLAILRQTLRSHLNSTPVFNPKSFTRDLEKAYRIAFQRWCERPQDLLLTA